MRQLNWGQQALKHAGKLTACLLLMAGLQQAQAADWSDTAISWRHGSKFAEPYLTNDITKNIFALTHADGYKYGSNFFNVDMLQSNNKKPGAGGGGSQETYVVYRHTLDLGKLSGSDMKFGPVRGVGITGGFDWNSDNDAGYGSKKRMLVLGPTLMFDVPGFFNVSLLILQESNEPVFVKSRYTFKTHPMLTGSWSIPFGAPGLAFEGFFNYIGSKGKDEGGGNTAAETNIDMQVMYDIGMAMGGPKSTFKLGLEYQYWKNKFGNQTTSKIGPGAGPGATAKTPMVRFEYHF